jgi:hypothetical protein
MKLMTKLEELEAARDAAVAVYYAAEAYDIAYDAAYDAAWDADAAYKAELKKQQINT